MENEKNKKNNCLEVSDKRLSGAEVAGSVNSDMNSAAVQTHYDKFNAAQGHGFAAEQAKHLYDLLTGNDALIVGGDNAKNGANEWNGLRKHSVCAAA